MSRSLVTVSLAFVIAMNLMGCPHPPPAKDVEFDGFTISPLGGATLTLVGDSMLVVSDLPQTGGGITIDLDDAKVFDLTFAELTDVPEGGGVSLETYGVTTTNPDSKVSTMRMTREGDSWRLSADYPGVNVNPNIVEVHAQNLIAGLIEGSLGVVAHVRDWPNDVGYGPAALVGGGDGTCPRGTSLYYQCLPTEVGVGTCREHWGFTETQSLRDCCTATGGVIKATCSGPVCTLFGYRKQVPITVSEQTLTGDVIRFLPSGSENVNSLSRVEVTGNEIDSFTIVRGDDSAGATDAGF